MTAVSDGGKCKSYDNDYSPLTSCGDDDLKKKIYSFLFPNIVSINVCLEK